MKSKSKSFIKFIILVVLILALIYFFNFTEFGSSFKTVEGRTLANEKIISFVEGFGAFSPIIYILMYALLTIVLFPGVILTFVGAILFGTLWGTIYTVIGATIGASGCFLAAKILGRDFVEKILKGGFKKFDKKCGEEGFRGILILRLIPLVPFNVLNFGPGLTKIKFKDYFWATFLGIIPGTFVYTYLFATFGEKVLTGSLTLNEVLTFEFITPIVLFVLLIIISLFIKKSKKLPIKGYI